MVILNNISTTRKLSNWTTAIDSAVHALFSYHLCLLRYIHTTSEGLGLNWSCNRVVGSKAMLEPEDYVPNLAGWTLYNG